MAPRPATEWERHKQTIIGLYRTKTLKDVVSEMLSEHKFQATPWQYEKQLKLWNIRKNTTRKEWEKFFDPSRDPQNVIVQSTQTPAGHSKSKASIQRSHRYLRQLQKQHGTTVDLTPQPTLQSDTNSIQQTCDNGSSTTLETGLAELGALRLAQSVGNPHELATTNVSPHIAHTWEPDQVDLIGPGMEWFDHYDQDMSTPRLAPSPIYELSLAIDPAFMQRQIMTSEIPPPVNNPIYFQRAQVSWGFHFVKFEKFLLSKGVTFGPSGDAISNKSAQSTHDGSALQLFTNFITSKSENRIMQSLAPLDIQRTLLRFLSLLPKQSIVLDLNHQASRTQLIRALLFSALNGFAGLGGFCPESIIELLWHLGTPSISIPFALEEGPPQTMKIFLDSMMIAAINTRNGSIVHQLLRIPRVNVNDIVIDSGKQRFTPIERAAMYGDVDIIRILVKAGADVNATHSIDRRRGGALMRFLESQQRHPVDDVDTSQSGPAPKTTACMIVEILLVAGAKVWPQHVQAASEFDDKAVASTIALNIKAADHKLFFNSRGMGGLKILVEVLGEQHALLTIQHLIVTCKESKCCTCRFPRVGRSCRQLAVFAARRRYVRLLEFLSGYIPLCADTLCAAIKSGSRPTIDLVLSRSPNLDRKCHRTVGRHFHRTPLSCAVRSGKIDLIGYFHSAGALRRLDEDSRFGPLIIAAAKWGDQGYLSMLVDLVDDWFNLDGVPIDAAAAAARSGHRSIAQFLLQYSPSREPCRRFRAKDSILSFALQHQDVQWAQGILHANVEVVHSYQFKTAFEWGDCSIISSLCHYGHDFIGHDSPDWEKAWQSFFVRCMEEHAIEVFHNIINSSTRQLRFLTGCFVHAVRTGKYDMVHYLLDIGVNPYTSDILTAIIQHQPDMLELITAKKRKRHHARQCIGARAIYDVMAATGNDPIAQSSALSALLGTGFVNLVALEQFMLGSDWISLTPLGLAIVRLSQNIDGSLWMVEALLNEGADPNSIASRRRRFRSPPAWEVPAFTGLLLGIRTGRVNLVQALLDRGGDINQEPQFCILRSPLQHACELGYMEMVRFLLQRGADVNARPAARRGGTALQFACITGNCNIAAMLLEHGAELGARPSQIHGRWPLEGAAEHGRLEMIQLLWDVKEQIVGGVEGFQRRQCLKAMAFAHQNGHMACRDLVSELSGIPIEALDRERVGAQWLAFTNLDREASGREWLSAGQEVWSKSRGVGILGGRRPRNWWSGNDSCSESGDSSGEDDDSSHENASSSSEADSTIDDESSQ